MPFAQYSTISASLGRRPAAPEDASIGNLFSADIVRFMLKGFPHIDQQVGPSFTVPVL
ncbi:MAG: hypothetical protein QM743_05070 [Chitinophagaceae bacterium]